MQENRRLLHLKIIANLCVTAAWILAIVLLGPWMIRFFSPLIVAAVIAMIANPLVSFLEDKIKIMRKHGSVIVIALVLVLVAAVLSFAVWELVVQISEWIVDLPDLYQNVITGIDESLAVLHRKMHFIPSDLEHLLPGNNGKFNDLILNFLDSLTDSPVKAVSSFAGSLIDGLVLSVLTIMIAYFFVADKKRIHLALSKYTPESAKNMWRVFRKIILTAVGGYLKACLKIMVVMFAILWAFFFAIGTKHAMVIAIITAMLDFLPFIGTGFVLGPWAAYMLLTGKYAYAIVLIIAYFVTLIVRRLLEPKLVSDSVGISPFLTLMSMFVGYRMLGMIGLIVGIPAGMILKALIEQGAFDSQIRGLKILAKDLEEFRKY